MYILCTLVIDGEGLTGGAVGTTAHAGLHASDQRRVRLVAGPVLPQSAVAEGADRQVDDIRLARSDLLIADAQAFRHAQAQHAPGAR